MRKISLVLASTAGLALLAGAAAAPAAAQIRLDLGFGPSTYYQPYNGYNQRYDGYRPYYGYNNGYYAYRPYDGYNNGYYSRPYGYPTYNSYGNYYNSPGYYGR